MLSVRVGNALCFLDTQLEIIERYVPDIVLQARSRINIPCFLSQIVDGVFLFS